MRGTGGALPAVRASGEGHPRGKTRPSPGKPRGKTLKRLEEAGRVPHRLSAPCSPGRPLSPQSRVPLLTGIPAPRLHAPSPPSVLPNRSVPLLLPKYLSAAPPLTASPSRAAFRPRAAGPAPQALRNR